MATSNRVALVSATPGDIQEKLDELNKEGFRLYEVVPIGSTTSAVLMFFESDDAPRTARSSSSR
jgi:hypothetical protein